MKLLFLVPYILTNLFALGYIDIPTNKDSSISRMDTIKGVTIYSSGKKGNGRLDASGKYGYHDPTGKNFAYIIFWNRVINESSAPVELSLNFPADSFSVSGSPKAYFHLFLPPDTMTLKKEPMDDYGLTGLKAFLDANFHQPAQLKREIDPGQESLFYVVVVSNSFDGVSHSELVLKGKSLFLKTNMRDELIPCGSIVLKK